MTESERPFVSLGVVKVNKEESLDPAGKVVFQVVLTSSSLAFLHTPLDGGVRVERVVSPTFDIPAVSDICQAYRTVGMLAVLRLGMYPADRPPVQRERPAWVTPYPQGAKLTRHARRRSADLGAKRDKRR